MRGLVLVLALGACPSSGPSGSSTTAASGSASAARAPASWPVPAGWKSETIPFPLDFAPGISHRGVEELRFPPGMFDPASGEYWSYAFTWRTDDPATLAAPILAAELTTYFRGLIAAVDEKKQQVTGKLDDIVATVTGIGEGETRFALAIALFDAFGDARPVALEGWAQRTACGEGSLWVFVMAPATSKLRPALESLASQAACGQTVTK